MSYRIHEHHPHKARRTVEATASPMKVFVTNGASAHIAFPCYYQEVVKPLPALHHNIHLHHHRGWPVYNHPDHICQMMYTPNMCGFKGGCKACRHYLDARTIFPIHLRDEAERYKDECEVVFWNDNGFVSEIGTSAWIDEADDWVVRVSFWPAIMEAITKPMHYRFTVFATADPYTTRVTDHKTGEEIVRNFPGRKDVVGLGELVVLPSGIEVRDLS